MDFTKKIDMKMIMLHITYRCNYKCRLCTSASPYFDVPPHFTLEDLKPVINRVFELANHIWRLTTSGGESLLHPELAGIIDYCSRFRDQFDIEEIITNGSIIPSDEVIEACVRSGKVEVLIDDYGPEISKKVDAVVERFEKANVAYRYRKYYGDDAYCGGWVNLRDLSKKLFTREEVEKRFNECIYPQNFNFCMPVSGGILHPCGVARRCYLENAVPKEELQFVNLMDITTSLAEKRAEIHALQTAKSLTACAYCNGFSINSKRYPPAEQLD